MREQGEASDRLGAQLLARASYSSVISRPRYQRQNAETGIPAGRASKGAACITGAVNARRHMDAFIYFQILDHDGPVGIEQCCSCRSPSKLARGGLTPSTARTRTLIVSIRVLLKRVYGLGYRQLLVHIHLYMKPAPLQSKYDKVEPEGSAPLSPLSSVSVWSTDRVGPQSADARAGERRAKTLESRRGEGLSGYSAEPAERASGYSGTSREGF